MPMDPQLIQEIRKKVDAGVRDVHEMKRHLEDYVLAVMCYGQVLDGSLLFNSSFGAFTIVEEGILCPSTPFRNIKMSIMTFINILILGREKWH